MPAVRQAAHGLVLLTAAAAALVPRPETVVERVYGQAVYPPLQALVTSWSNRLPVAAFDLLVSAGLALLVWWWARALVALRRRRQWRPTARALVASSTLAAVAYLWFLAAWGLNYSRSPIDIRLGLPPGAASANEVAALLDEAIAAVNGLHPFVEADASAAASPDADIAAALHAVEARHGRPRATVTGRPKPTLFAPYFRMAGVDGLTAPLALETLLNPDLTAAERPFVLAHEWAHLAGYAPEADANFVAWLVTQESDVRPRTRYSGGLFLVSEAARQVPAETRRSRLAALGPGPRRDLAEIARRMATRVDVVEKVGWRVYDSYLRSQGVDDGVRSYSRVVELIVRARRTGAPLAVPQ